MPRRVAPAGTLGDEPPGALPIYPSRCMKRPGPVTTIVAVLALGLIGLLVYGVLNTGDDTTLDAAVKRGERPVAPGADVKLPELDGKGRMAVAELRGKVVVLNFWASWCDPCREEAPVLERAHRRLQKAGAGTVLGVTYKDFADESRKFAREVKITYPSLRDDKLELAPKYGTTRLPETFVIDREGRVAAMSRGQVEQEWVDGALDRVLGDGSG